MFDWSIGRLEWSWCLVPDDTEEHETRDVVILSMHSESILDCSLLQD